MSCQILAFPADRIRRATAAAAAVRDNVLSLEEFRSQARPLRTTNGVFFTSQVLAFSGSAA